MMRITRPAILFGKKAHSIDVGLLLFLVLFMDVKLAVKFFALLLICFLRPDFKFGFRFKNSRLPLFYPLAIGIIILDYFIYRNFSANYTAVMFTGILFWGASILAVHQIKLFTERVDIHILKNTLAAFFLLNVIFSFVDLAAILTEIGLRNPFNYQGQYQKYFINTGDHIKGVLFDVSTTNAVINCFGIIYFLYQKKYLPVIACMVVLIMTASNAADMILLLVFAGLFLLKSIREQKSMMIICTMLLAVFLVKLSPQNNNYLLATVNKFFLKKDHATGHPAKEIPIRDRPDSLLTPESRKEKTAVLFLDSLERDRLKHTDTAGKQVFTEKPVIPKDSIHTPTFQWKRDTTAVQAQLISYIKSEPVHPDSIYDKGSAGKLIAFRQSVDFLKAHPFKIITGLGAGNFSSKLAFRATGLNIAGGFPKRFVYTDPDFLNNHFNLYAYFFLQNASFHSVIHNPASVYDQLLAEYGLAGLAAFGICYAGFFFKRIKRYSFAMPVLIMLLAFFTLDYWFEQLSVVVLFELMMFIDIKETKQKALNE